MTRRVMATFVFASSVIALGVAGQSGTPAVVSPDLPESLNRFYPPQTQAPAYRLEMLALGGPFSGLMSDFFEGDAANAIANFEAFEAQYRKVLALVPEWTEAFPEVPVKTLGEALRSGDPGAVGAAAEAVGRSCHACHAATMVPVQQRFYWGDFSAISATDPASGRSVSFPELMRLIESDLSGAGNDMAQGQPDGARAHAANLGSRLETLKETCAACHDSDREYYVDDGVLKLVADLGAAVESGTPDRLMELMQQIGQESCFGCHLVHLPAAYAVHRGQAH